MDSNIYEYLNKQWKSTCKVLLAGEIGELEEYAEWLYTGNGPRMIKKSAVSGADVVYANLNYSPCSKWVSYDEVDFGKKYEPLGINDIKDIDSLVSAVSERIRYAGNIVLGNSKFVEKSTNITDCFYAYHCERVAFSKNVAYSTRGGYSENIFGCYGFGPVFFSIKSNAITESTRMFLVSKADFSSDCYYSHGLSGCMECMFCFNLKTKRNAIGNLVLPKEKYVQLKQKLLGEIREKLKTEKRLPSVVELVKMHAPDYKKMKNALSGASWESEKTDKTRIEEAFGQTTKILLGKALNPIDDYGEWMKKNSSIRLDDGKSCASGTPLMLPDYAGFLSYPKDRLLTQNEADFAGERLALQESDVVRLSLDNAGELISEIAYFSPFWFAGKLKNNIDCPLGIDSVDCYKGIINIRSRLCGFCFSPRSCEYDFGGREGRHVSFSINCSFSTRLTRCFEVDSSNDCSDCYFCHNVENVQEGMFCLNTKSKRYAIGNVEVGREKYMEAKKALLSWILEKLERDKKLELNVLSAAAAQNKRF